jgi:hypothetical protein
MGKASSSKKVARAAGTGGGRTNRSSTPWTYAGLLALIVVVGVALTYTSRNRAQHKASSTTASNAAVAPTVGGTAWNEAYGIYVCNAFVPPIKAPSNAEGLTTDGNGVIHIAPKVKSSAGKNATLAEWAKAIGMTLTPSALQLPGAKRYNNGDDCGGKPAKVYIKQFPYVGAVVGTINTEDPSAIRLTDKAMVTIAFVPSSDASKIPAPPAAAQAALRKVDTAATTTTTAPSTTSTTTPATTSTTTKKASSSTTTKSTSSTTTKKASSSTTTKKASSSSTTKAATGTGAASSASS